MFKASKQQYDPEDNEVLVNGHSHTCVNIGRIFDPAGEGPDHFRGLSYSPSQSLVQSDYYANLEMYLE